MKNQSQLADAQARVSTALRNGFKGTVAAIAAELSIKEQTVSRALRLLKERGDARATEQDVHDEWGRWRARCHVWAASEQLLSAGPVKVLPMVEAALAHRSRHDAISLAWWPQCAPQGRVQARL